MSQPKTNIIQYSLNKETRNKAMYSISKFGNYYTLEGVIYPEEVFNKKFPLELKRLKLKGESPDTRTNWT